MLNFQQAVVFGESDAVKKRRAAAGISETCVYTIVHSETLAEKAKVGGVASFREGRRWATARRLLGATRRLGLRVPVVFAAAEDTTDLIYVGWLEKVILGAAGSRLATTFRVSGFRPIRARRPKKTSLIVASTGRHIPGSHIRPYVLCETPAFVRRLRPPTLRKVKLRPLLLFSWGYWGWGNAAPELRRAVDAAERARGFRPPIFVDVRIRRNVRAQGFNGKAFESLVRRGRHRWINDLGNKAVVKGGRMRIKDRRAAARLLDLAIEASGRRQRILFFCACERPRSGRGGCHRVKVATLVLEEARRRGLSVVIQEWPGGEPTRNGLRIHDADLKAGDQAITVRIGSRLSLAQAASLPWGTKLKLDDDGRKPLLTGPVQRRARRWVLPVFRGEAPGALRRKRGYLARCERDVKPATSQD